ncbi:MAG: hypothetical protein JNL62_07455, partial [Bryobacterales bacterium]|nr:hypothetical protein [Bryobacterales bacterium]
MNVSIPEHTRPELIAALAELFARGDVVACVETTRGRRRKGLVLNADAIEAGIAGAFRASYWLTAQGGARWAEHAGIDWRLWVDEGRPFRTESFATADPELTRFLFERQVRSGVARGPGRWRELRPWKATYWHEEPVGYEVRFRETEGPRIKDDCYPFVWQEGLLGWRDRRRGLAARRGRAEPERARPFAAMTDKQLAKGQRHRSPLMRLASSMELARRADDVDRLVDLLHFSCPIARFCGAKELGERKAVKAVDALMQVAFRWNDVAAVQALGQIAEVRTLAPLLVLYEWWKGWGSSGAPQFRAELERAILAFGDEAVERIEALMVERRISQHVAFDAIERSRSRRAVEFMVRHFGGDSYPVMKLMAQMGDEARAVLFAQAREGGWSAARALSRSPGPFREEGRQIAEEYGQRSND